MLLWVRHLWVLVLLVFVVSCTTAAKRTPPPTSEELAHRLGLTDDRGRPLGSDSRRGNPDSYTPAGIHILDQDGKPASLAAYQGKWLLLDFFATYAIPSQMQMPKLMDLQRRYSERGLAVVGISLDMQARVMLKPFLTSLGIEYPVYIASGTTMEGRTPYGFVTEIPVTLLIDPDGKLIKGYLGAYKVEQIEDEIKRHIKTP